MYKYIHTIHIYIQTKNRDRGLLYLSIAFNRMLYTFYMVGDSVPRDLVAELLKLEAEKSSNRQFKLH